MNSLIFPNYLRKHAPIYSTSLQKNKLTKSMRNHSPSHRNHPHLTMILSLYLVYPPVMRGDRGSIPRQRALLPELFTLLRWFPSDVKGGIQWARRTSFRIDHTVRGITDGEDMSTTGSKQSAGDTDANYCTPFSRGIVLFFSNEGESIPLFCKLAAGRCHASHPTSSKKKMNILRIGNTNS